MKQVISLDRLRRAKGWYEKPLTIKIHLSFKKSTLIILFLLAVIIYLVSRNSVAALTPNVTIPVGTNQTKTPTTIPLVTFTQNKGGFTYFEDTIKARDDRIAAEKAAALKAQQEAEAEKQKAAELAASLSSSQAAAERTNSLPQVYHAPAPTGVTNCGSDPQMAYIYRVESGCNTCSVYSGLSDCGYMGSKPCGLAQANPCTKTGCSMTDWNCQNNWARDYAVQTYGSIYNAYIFRQGHNYW